MKRALIFALICSSTAVTNLQAQTYQWKDSSGKTIISDTPPPSSTKPAKTVGSSSSVSSNSDNAGKSYAEREMEFKKRQQEAKEKAEKDAKETSASNERKENCERARRQLAVLESGQRMSTVDENGERRFIEDAERQREIERTRRYVADTCK